MMYTRGPVYRTIFRLLLAICWIKCSKPQESPNKCDGSVAKTMPLRLRQLENRLDLLPLLCKATLTTNSKASQDLKQITEFCFTADRSINYRFDVSRLGSQLKCAGGKVGCAAILLPKAV